MIMAQQPGVIEFGKELAREVADFIFTNSQENLIELGAIDTSNLFISGSIKEKENFILIHYDAPYAEAVNDGTDPHFVDAKELEGWVRRKINPKGVKKVKSIAFAVSKSIAKRGTVPQPFMTKAIELAKSKFNIKEI